MPTNILRKSAKPPRSSAPASSGTRASGRREVFIRSGAVVVRAWLLDTPTADRIWATLPIYSTVETWGRGAIHFETHAETGRERGARWNVAPGEIAYWVEQDRVIIGFAPTPISRPGEIRLPSPCNIWATALDDVAQLATLQPGQKIAILEAAS